MATVRKVLGQSAPAANTNTDLYAVPAATSTVCSSIMVANRGVSATTFRVAVRPAGVALDDEHFLYFDVELPGFDTFAGTLGVTLAATDVVTVRAGNSNVSFSLFGEEVS